MSIPELLRRLIASIGVFGTMVALIFSLREPHTAFTTLQRGLLVAFVILGVADIWFVFADFWRARHKIYKGERAIRNYMFQWIKKGGNVKIFSRNLTWVNDEEMRLMLEEKAKSDELTLVLPKATELSEQLKTAGATIHLYGKLRVELRSRFTIAHSGSADSTVAIGTSTGDKHYVEQYSTRSFDPAYFLAEDLAAVLKAYCDGAPQISASGENAH